MTCIAPSACQAHSCEATKAAAPRPPSRNASRATPMLPRRAARDATSIATLPAASSAVDSHTCHGSAMRCQSGLSIRSA
ncbi:hypothetical protein D3C72_1772760 [compost metagenome]